MTKLTGKRRQIVRAFKRKRLLTEENCQKASYNHDHNQRLSYAAGQVELAVDSLTNWQRSQWARAGYPGGRFGDRDIKKIEGFLGMRKST